MAFHVGLVFQEPFQCELEVFQIQRFLKREASQFLPVYVAREIETRLAFFSHFHFIRMVLTLFAIVAHCVICNCFI